ncbi:MULTISPECIES: PTS sugar transporter subunit IIA [unclassified Gemella]|uniref:PTS sugar transporter subunit IIA n=1 Tax=unclassified Gemella TaxID=2624949 RepID=UPI0010739648|nr:MULTISPECIES: PTS sugar transporter subunit IIA [unclassified Gemella]MBF0709958.1 PTS sugar transporter subunit IIA [Gemella sp. GL1.1]MBF0747329.1 PTS sugar transporter subunit IIA [Gemella sp. 19428wG2_WT2a]NYS27302.1 PTS sugar transporter subunit IIA [Gemella sp. GL1]TFU57523.1 PTS mannitol transporter subunit IIA [Gemella sp. WT2a]
MLLKKTDIRLGQEFSNKEEAIKAAGKLLVEAGYVEPEYVDAMLEREEIVSTYMGNFIAIPHGTDDAKKSIKNTGISVLQIPAGVSFAKEGEEEDKLVFIVFGIAGKDGEHLDLLSKIAIFCSEQENVVKLHQAKSEEEIINLLSVE